MKKILIGLGILSIYMLSMTAKIFAEEINDSEEIVTKVIGGFTDQDNSYIDVLVNHQIKTKNRRGIIIHFCDVMLGVYQDAKLAHPSFPYNNTLYDPKKSLFVYSLCVNMDKAPGHTKYKDQFVATPEFDIQKLIKQDIPDLNRIWNIDAQDPLDAESAYDDCNPKTSMGNCNFMNFLPDIYTTIMNDLSNIKLASLYGYKYDHNKKEEREKAIKEFAELYFHNPESPETTCNDRGLYFTYHTQQQDGSRVQCSHPKTYQYLDQMIQSAGSLVKKTKFLDGKSIMAGVCTNTDKNPMFCAMSSTGTLGFAQGSWASFQDVVLNEQMFYNLFLAYYQGLIDEFINYQPLNFKGIGVALERDSFESLTIAHEQTMAQQASYQMFRQLENLYATLPIHVGLLAYYEDLLYLRNRLTTLYTPLHQLYYEFRNAQECSN